MRIFLILSVLFVCEGFAATNLVRQKRSMLAIRRFMCGLFGWNCNLPTSRYILRRPVNRNIYTVIDDDFYVKSIPDYNLRNVILRNYYESVPFYQVNGYMVDENDYVQSMKSPYEKKPISVEKLSKEKDIELGNVVYGNNVLPPRPLYIQNRINKLNNMSSVHITLAPNKIERPVVQFPPGSILVPPTSEVHVSKYPLVRTSYNNSAFIKEKLQSLKPLTSLVSPLNDIVTPRTTTTVTQTTTPEVTERTKLKMNPPEPLQKAVKFSEPIPLKYNNKNVFHMQPDKTTDAIPDTTYISTTEATSTTKSEPFKISNSDFFKLPPIKKIEPLTSVNKENTYKENNKDKDLVADKPMVEDPFTNKRDDQFKLGKPYEQRGDIPSSFWQ